ncbi:hypothetical protein C8Q76DRAFT_579084, partial [Earliella scabrosa]
FYVDDALTGEEEDILCGVYTLYTEQSGQIEYASWWPRRSQWASSGMNTGIWNAWNEAWFVRRREEIRKGKALPLNGKKWKS